MKCAAIPAIRPASTAPFMAIGGTKRFAPVKPPIVLVCVAVLLTFLLPSCTTDRSPSSPPTTASPHPSAIALHSLSGRILFTRAGGPYGDETVFTANADGTDQRRITPFGAELPHAGQCCPRWAPDGTHISIAVPGPAGRIAPAIIDANGTGKSDLPLPDRTLNLGPFAWSPDARKIAFQGWDDTDPSRAGIYIGRASDGGDLVRVTRNRQGGADLPGDFSPDGKKLVFFRERSDVRSVGRLFVVNVDGTDLHPITPATMAVGFGTVRWSPDGTEILFQDAQDQDHGYIWTVRPDGSGLRKAFVDPQGRFAITPTWSPDGAFIMFALDPTADEFSHPSNGLYVIRRDGTGLTLVIGGSDFKREPDWVAAG